MDRSIQEQNIYDRREVLKAALSSIVLSGCAFSSFIKNSIVAEDLLIAPKKVKTLNDFLTRDPRLRGIIRSSMIPREEYDRRIKAVNVLSHAMLEIDRHRKIIKNAPKDLKQHHTNAAISSLHNIACGEIKPLNMISAMELCNLFNRYEYKANKIESNSKVFNRGVGAGSLVLGLIAKNQKIATIIGLKTLFTEELISQTSSKKAETLRLAPRDYSLLDKSYALISEMREHLETDFPEAILIFSKSFSNEKAKENIGVDLGKSIEKIVEELPEEIRQKLDRVIESPESATELIKAERKNLVKQTKNAYLNKSMQKSSTKSTSPPNPKERQRTINDFRMTVDLLQNVARITENEELFVLAQGAATTVGILDIFNKHHFDEELSEFGMGVGVTSLVLGFALNFMSSKKTDPVLEMLDVIYKELREIRELMLEGFSTIISQNETIIDLSLEILSELRKGKFFTGLIFQEVIDELASKRREERQRDREAVIGKFSEARLRLDLAIEREKESGGINDVRVLHDELVSVFAIIAKDASRYISFNGSIEGAKIPTNEIKRALDIGDNTFNLAGMLPLASQILRIDSKRPLPAKLLTHKLDIPNPCVWAAGTGSFLDAREYFGDKVPYGRVLKREVRAIHNIGISINNQVKELTKREELEQGIEAYKQRGYQVADHIAAIIEKKAKEIWKPRETLVPSKVALADHFKHLSVGELYFPEGKEHLLNPPDRNKTVNYNHLPKEASRIYFVFGSFTGNRLQTINFNSDAFDPVLLAEDLDLLQFEGRGRSELSFENGPFPSLGRVRVNYHAVEPNGRPRIIGFYSPVAETIFKKFGAPRTGKKALYEGSNEQLSEQEKKDFEAIKNSANYHMTPFVASILRYRSHCGDVLTQLVHDQSVFEINEKIYRDFEITADALGLLFAYAAWRTEGSPEYLERKLPASRVSRFLSFLPSASFQFLKQEYSWGLHKGNGGLRPIKSNLPGEKERKPNPVWEDVRTVIQSQIDKTADNLSKALDSLEQERGLLPVDIMLELCKIHFSKYGL